MKRIATLMAFLILASLLVTACSANQAGASPQDEILSEPAIESEVSVDNQQSSKAAPTSDDSANIDDETSNDSNEITGGSTLEDAEMLLTNVRYTGSFGEDDIWVSFNTTSDADTEYVITMVNLTTESKSVWATMYDADNNAVKPTERDNDYYSYGVDTPLCIALQDGEANSGMASSLESDSTYYLLLEGKNETNFSLVISTKGQSYPSPERDILSADKELPVSTNQDEAQLLQINTKYTGQYEGQTSWFAFETGNNSNCSYTVTLENITPQSDDLEAYMVDVYGKNINPTERDNDKYSYYSEYPFCIAKQDGTANSGMIDTLQPETTYFLRIDGDDDVKYILSISSSDSTTGINEEETDAAENNIQNSILQNKTIIPGSNQSASVNVPLGTTVFGDYVDGYSWLSFTTNDYKDSKYYVTVVNRSTGSENLYAYVVDKYGKIVNPTERDNDKYSYDSEYPFCIAGKNGTANTGMAADLKPNTTYYVRINGSGAADYAFRVSSPAPNSEAYQTSSILAETLSVLKETDSFYTGTNQIDSTLIGINIAYYGNYDDENQCDWVSFRTTEDENIVYSVTLENLTVNSENMYAYVFDEYGYIVNPTERNNDLYSYYSKYPFCEAKQDGTANTGFVDYLQPNTTYYVRVEGGSKADYMIMIGAPEPDAPEVIEDSVEEDVVFEVPFELNETQVRFVANEAIFIDEEAAKAALAPVAEIILAHPDHPILLAGTTAQWGSQDSCVNLSNRRAGAIKDLLVNYFGVPESQLVTAGLGYADDPFVRGQDVDSNGNFVETEGAKNRRVVVLDAESDIARQILGN